MSDSTVSRILSVCTSFRFQTHWLIVALYYCIQKTGLTHFPPLLSSSPRESTLSPPDVTLTPYNGNENLLLPLSLENCILEAVMASLFSPFIFYPPHSQVFSRAFINYIFILSMVPPFLSHSLKGMRTRGNHSLPQELPVGGSKGEFVFYFYFFH